MKLSLIVELHSASTYTSLDILPVYVEAECNSTISDSFIRGYVIGENLNISVIIGDFVAVKYSRICSKERCHFHPAFTRRKGSLPAALVTNNFVNTNSNYSILLSVVMKKTGMYHESLHVLTIILYFSRNGL